MKEQQADARYQVVGRIRTVFGVHGWLKVESYTEPPSNIFDYSHWRVTQPNGEVTEFPVKETKKQGKDLLVFLDGIQSREHAREFSQSDIAVPLEQMPELEEDDFYWHQLVGLEVVQAANDETSQITLGKVDHLLETGSNDVLVVRVTDKSVLEWLDSQSDKQEEKKASKPSSKRALREVLIPYLYGSVVKSVDLDSKQILVDWYYI